MWIYEKRLEFPVNIKEPNAKMAMFIMSQYGGPDGEMGAYMRYLSQRYSMPYKECKAVLTDIGTEELAHLEIVAAIIHQLTRNLTAEQLAEQGFGPYYIDHATGIWPQAAGGVPFNACEFQSKGDIITDLHEYMAAEQKARTFVDLMKWGAAKGIDSMTYGSLGSGILSGAIRTLPDFAPNDLRLTFYDFFKEPKFSKIMELLKVMDQIAESHKKPVAQVAVNWSTQKDYVGTALVGVRNEQEARENCAAFDWELTDQEIQLLDDEIKRLGI